MNLWTYRRPFTLHGEAWRVEAVATLTQLKSRLYKGDEQVDELELMVNHGLRTLVHEASLADGTPVRVDVGYFNWLNVGVEVRVGDELVHESHPGKDIHFGAKKFGVSSKMARRSSQSIGQWEQNKYSIFADIALGLVFFAAGKITGDLSLAAIIGAGAGLALVAAQKFVKVDLLGGFAVFGTIMLLVSALFSLVFQSEYMVQMKTTIFGVGTAVLFLGDGLFREGAYFGARLQRYLPGSIHPGKMAIGLGVTGIAMALANYAVAELFSEDAWLTYTTFIDTPLGIGMGYAAYFYALESGTADDDTPSDG